MDVILTTTNDTWDEYSKKPQGGEAVLWLCLTSRSTGSVDGKEFGRDFFLGGALAPTTSAAL